MNRNLWLLIFLPPVFEVTKGSLTESHVKKWTGHGLEIARVGQHVKRLLYFIDQTHSEIKTRQVRE